MADRNTNPLYNPETGEVEIKWQEQPALIAEVKEKVSEIIHGDNAKQLVTTQDAVKYLRKNLDLELAAIICSVEPKMLMKFGTGKAEPSSLQARNIAAAYVILDILLAYIPPQRAKEWLIEYNDYLYGIPAVEMARRPEDVRIAATYFLAQ